LTVEFKKSSVGIYSQWEHNMQTDENDVFDESVDPYDRNIDFEYDDGIADLPSDELDDADDADWDSNYEDEPETVAVKTASSDEMADYDALED